MNTHPDPNSPPPYHAPDASPNSHWITDGTDTQANINDEKPRHDLKGVGSGESLDTPSNTFAESLDAITEHTPPTTFLINGRRTAPFVRIAQLKGHLVLLHALRVLRIAVEQGGDERFPQAVQSMGPDARWGWFVNLAVERFERWCLGIRHDDVPSENLPPLDVIMIWHTYLLNPGNFAEDTMRVSQLKVLNKYTEDMKTYLANPDILITDNPSPERLASWVNRTSTPYAPADAVAVLTHKDIQCPLCSTKLAIPFITSSGTGYAQRKFLHKCDCGFAVTKEVLGLIKLVRNLVETSTPDKYLASTLHTPTEIFDEKRASAIRDRVNEGVFFNQASLEEASNNGREAEKIVHQKLLSIEWSSKKLYGFMRPYVHSQVRDRLYSTYIDNRIFSLDLVGAVLRQGSFIKKMFDLGWTQPGFFDTPEDEVVLQHCIARYHAFLGLTAESPDSFLVPTLDIDLAWHTHQLMADAYQNDCITYIKRYIDHNDKVEEDHLSTSFDATCRAWQTRYRVPYMHCGCPLPGDSIGQKLRRLVKRSVSVRASASNTSTGGQALLPPDTPMSLAATHPSEHNAVFALHLKNESLLARETRQKQDAQRRERDAKDRNGGGFSSKVMEHEQAFLRPVPMYYYAPGGCVASNGGVVTGPTNIPGGLEIATGGCASNCAVGAGLSTGISSGANCGGATYASANSRCGGSGGMCALGGYGGAAH